MPKSIVENLPDEVGIRRLFQELEHNIKHINTEKISEITGSVTKDAFIEVATTTARLRARYLARVVELTTSDDIKPEGMKLLRESRMMFEEAMEGFSALQHALTRGYFSLDLEE